MKRSQIYQVNGVTVDEREIQNALDSVSNDRRVQVLQEVFRMMQLLNKYETDHSNFTVQQNIKNIVDRKFRQSNRQINNNMKSTSSLISQNDTFLLNKSGSLGRMLQRSCQVHESRILQWQSNRKQAKQKEIVGFVQKIQEINNKSKSNDPLSWHSKGSEYPYRVIVVNKEQKNKAIYCKNQQDAKRLQIYFLNQFNIKTNIPRIINQLNYGVFKKTIYNKFCQRLFAKHRQIKKRVEQQMKAKKPVKQQEVKIREDVFSSSILKKSGMKAQFIQNFDNSKFQDKIRYSQKKIIQNKELIYNTVEKLQKSYCQQMLVKWRSQAIKVKKIKEKPQIQKKMTIEKPQVQDHILSSVNINFIAIQFLKINYHFFKPLVNIQLLKNTKVLYEATFNTFLKTKTPYLGYKLIINKGQQSFNSANLGLQQRNIKQYTLNIMVVDFLTNEKIINQRIDLKTKILSPQTFILDSSKSIRLQILYNDNAMILNKHLNSFDGFKGQQFQNRNQNQIVEVNLQVQPLNQEIIKKIKFYWQEQSIKKGYYSIDSKMKITQILGLGADSPEYWWIGLTQEQYSILSMLKTASKIIGFKLLKSFLHIVNAMKVLFSSTEQFIQKILSIIVNYAYCYFFQEQIKKTNKLHTILGLGSNYEFSSKIKLQMNILDRIVELQCPKIYHVFKKRNICYNYCMYQYTYELFCRNLPIKILVQVWNYYFKQPAFIPLHFLLIAAWLLKHHQQALRDCRRLAQFREILQKKPDCKSQKIIREVTELRSKYFQESNDLVSQIKNIFREKPLEQVINQFYKQQSQKIDKRRLNKQSEKRTLLTKFRAGRQIELPGYPSKPLCFHIFFTKVPTIRGSLYLKTSTAEYDCISFEKQKYFIISQVSSPITVEFIDNKNNIYSGQLLTIRGVNQFSITLVSIQSQDHTKLVEISYVCGLLTENQFQTFKKNRKFQQFLGPFIVLEELQDQMLRPINQSAFIKLIDQNKIQKQSQIGKKLKVLFTQGTKSFNQVQLYLRWIECSTLSLPQKLQLVKQYALKLSLQFFLSHNKIIQKFLIRKFLIYTQFPFNNLNFQSCYNDSLQSQFDAPKIMKCIFIKLDKQIQLQQHVIKYYSQKSTKYLYGDLNINELFLYCKDKIQQGLGNPITQGVLSILYSCNSKLKCRKYKVGRKLNKQLFLEQVNQQMKQVFDEILFEQPYLLMTQVLPTFSKISTILNYVNSSREIDVMTVRQKQKQAQCINILKNCKKKLQYNIRLRYAMFPTKLYFPFFQYYYGLTQNVKQIKFPTIFFNNTKSDIKSVCVSKTPIKFSESKRGQTINLDRQLGLYGNIRKINLSVQSIYFWTYIKQQSQNQLYLQCQVFVNYGFGVFRWEKCLVKGYQYNIKKRKTKIEQNSYSLPKKQYLVRWKNRQFFVRNYQLNIDTEIESKLPKLQSVSQIRQRQGQSLRKKTNN